MHSTLMLKSWQRFVCHCLVADCKDCAAAKDVEAGEQAVPRPIECNVTLLADDRAQD